MSWLGIKVLPRQDVTVSGSNVERPVGSTCPDNDIQVGQNS